MNEIESLREAIALSPNNVVLLKLFAKTCLAHPEYRPEGKKSLERAIELDNNDIGSKNLLLEYYFLEKNYNAVVILSEDVGSGLSAENQLKVAKAYFHLDELERSREIYQRLLSQYPDMNDDMLDEHFRAKTTSQKIVGNITMQHNVDIKFDDVGGMSEIKRDISLKIIEPFRNPEIYKQFGKKAGGGLLLFGPPGCGKTHIARATAGETGANFINVGIHDILDMWIGNSEKNLNHLFETARANTPCVIFIDELDALGVKRSTVKGGGKNVINQLLMEMDGMASKNDDILVIGATNTPWAIDEALRRPGRFDKMIFVPPPDDEARAEIFKMYLEEKPNKISSYNFLSKSTNLFSGADIRGLIDIVSEDKIEASLAAGKVLPIEESEILKRIKGYKPTTTDWFITIKNYTLFANKSGMYDEVVEYMKRNRI